MMKRRNVESSKYRKQFHFRKYRFTDGIYASNTFLYLKFLLIWILIMFADYILEFRFEFLWPFWLLIRSLHDSFKYQGIVRFILFKINQIKFVFFLETWNLTFFTWIQIDFLRFFRLDRISLRLILLHVPTGSMACLCRQHLRLGTVRVAHRERRMFAYSLAMAAVCVFRSLVSAQKCENNRLVSTIRRSLHWLPNGHAGFWLQELSKLQVSLAEAEVHSEKELVLLAIDCQISASWTTAKR